MRKFLALGMVALSASVSMAGPFGLIGRRGQNGGQPVQYAQQGPVRTVVAGTFSTAQGVANYLASIGRIGHFGGNPYAAEGVGMGATPDQAIRNCCFYGKRPIADQGVCRGANGYYFACCRYN
jgi:hypothetical protein